MARPHHPTKSCARHLRSLLCFASALAVLPMLLPDTAAGVPIDPIAPIEPIDPEDPWDPGDPEDPGDLPYDPPAGGFDWSAPAHFNMNSSRWTEAGSPGASRYDPGYVRPSSWPIDVNGCRTAEDAAAADGSTPNRYRFETGDGQTIDGHTCSPRIQFPQEGDYEVRMTVTAPGGAHIGTWTQPVTVNNILVVQIGDSYGSGEGAPDVKRAQTGGEYADWQDDRCHRSRFAASSQAAQTLESASTKTSVTFLSFACSGATINTEYWDGNGDVFDPYEPGDPNKPVGTGVLGPYRGAQPTNPDDYSAGNMYPSQLDQLKAALSDGVPAGQVRRIDALFMSAGGNDAAFGPLAQACLTNANCVDPGLRFRLSNGGEGSLSTRVQQDLARLPGLYDQLEAALDNLPIPIAQRFITEYPDPGTDVGGGQCAEILEDVMWLLGWKIQGGEVTFARSTFMAGLNSALRSAVQRHGWGLVDMAGAFDGHGYCVGPNDSEDAQRFVQTFAMSSVYQGPNAREKTKGGLHPNYNGQNAIKGRILAVAQGQIQALGHGGPYYRLPTAPGAPTNVAAVATSPTSARVSFSPGPDGGLAVSEFRAECTSSDGGAHGAATGGSSPLQVPGLTPEKTYRCQVRATNPRGDSPWSSPSPAFTTPASATAPDTIITSPKPTWQLAAAPTYAFTSSEASEPDPLFDCSVDGAGWIGCESPYRAAWSAGTHELKVRAIGATGLPDETPAVVTWTSPYDDRQLTRKGKWAAATGKAFYRGTALTTRTRAHTLTLRGATAREVVLVATTCRSCGTVRVYVGSTPMKKISLVSRTTRNKQVIPVGTWSTPVERRIKIVVLTQGKKVVIDGLGVRG